MLSQRIREAREKAGLNLSELATKAGVSKAYLSQLENNDTKRPSAEIVFKLANALGVTMGQLLEREVQISEEDVEALPPSLREFLRDTSIPPEDVHMLAQVRFRGRQPSTADDWRYLYDSIKRSIRDNG